jgi:peptidoglycan hydrolase CwlO-like protein
MLKQTKIVHLLLTLSLCLLATFAIAKDITNEQRNAYEARKLYNENKSDYESLINRISELQSDIADDQQKLDQLKADEIKAKMDLERSKTDLETKTKLLNDVWDSRDP